jgi:hypothetical protein
MAHLRQYQFNTVHYFLADGFEALFLADGLAADFLAEGLAADFLADGLAGDFLADLTGVFLADLAIGLVLLADGLAALFLADLTGVVGLAGEVGSTTGVTGLAGDSTFLALEFDLFVADFLADYKLFRFIK